MTITEIVLLTLLAVSIILLVVVFFYYRFCRQYTRERFAFRVFLLIASLSSSLIVLLLSGKNTFDGTVSILARSLGTGGVAFEPSYSDKILAVILIIALMYFALKLHRNWPGEISEREHEARLFGLTPRLFGDTIAAIADFTGKVPLQIYSTDRSGVAERDIALLPADTKAWHAWVARILQLSSNQVHIDELRDWFSDKQIFVSTYGPKNVVLGVLCQSKKPGQTGVADA